MTVVIALSSAGWALHTWQKSNASLDISGQVSIGGDVTQVGGDLIITGDPVDQKTIGHLNNLLDRYRAELDQRDIELADKEALIAQLKTTLELAQKIAAGGDDQLASRARALLADLEPGSLGAALLPDLRALIQDYEQGPIKDLVQLHMGEGALTFYGDPQASLAAYRRAHALDPENIVAINFIGALELLFGNLKAAEDAFRQVLDLGRTRDDQGAIATAYGNLGIIATMRGDLEEAVEYHTQALALDKELGRKAGMAAIYGNLGLVAEKRGDSEMAVDYYNQALALDHVLGRKEGMARQYGHLGVAAAKQGDLELAVDYYNQALSLDKEVGGKEGMATHYGNLGVVAEKRGDWDMAVEYYTQALALDKELGSKEGMARHYGNLGVVAAARDDLDAAVDYFNQALALDKELGRKEGMASNYANLGSVAVARGEFMEARQFWVQARGLYAEMGVQPMVAEMEEWLADLEPPAEP
ncbi:tetratricopeptide repeat protein [Planktomarina temperata]|nr:tetratricopeptide repeat protein [Planktomarina temperata]